MIDRNHALPLTRQAELVGISRGNVYYLARAASAADLRLMRRIDELSLAHPFAGSRMLRDMLNREGFGVGRRHVATLMRRMGIEALYRKPNTSKKHPNHKIYPYLLRELKIDRANQVWASDITYVPMACGWVYLCAIVDWASRKVWRTGCRSAWTRRSAWRRSKRPSQSTASPRSSIPTRAASSRARRSPRR
jgi:putative transposase